MIRHRDVEQLQQLSQAPGKTLTVYLDVDQTNPANRKRQFETHLKDLLKQLRASHPDDEELAQACGEVEEITKRIEPTGRTLVLARHRKLGVTFRKVIRIGLPSFAYWSNYADDDNGGSESTRRCVSADCAESGEEKVASQCPTTHRHPGHARHGRIQPLAGRAPRSTCPGGRGHGQSHPG